MQQQVKDMVQKMEADPVFEQKMKDDPIAAMKEMKSPLSSDKFIYRIGIIAMSTVAVACTVGSLVLQALGQATPDAVLSFGGIALGALAMLLKPGKDD